MHVSRNYEPSATCAMRAFYRKYTECAEYAEYGENAEYAEYAEYTNHVLPPLLGALRHG